MRDPSEVAYHWYRPHQSCLMRYLYKEYCPVCMETLIESIHENSRNIIGYSPDSDDILIEDDDVTFSVDLLKPEPNTLKVDWVLDDATVGAQCGADAHQKRHPARRHSHADSVCGRHHADGENPRPCRHSPLWRRLEHPSQGRHRHRQRQRSLTRLHHWSPALHHPPHFPQQGADGGRHTHGTVGCGRPMRRKQQRPQRHTVRPDSPATARGCLPAACLCRRAADLPTQSDKTVNSRSHLIKKIFKKENNLSFFYLPL